MRLVILGLGYSASHFLAEARERFASRLLDVTATVRDQRRAAAMSGDTVEVLSFDGASASQKLADRIMRADAMLVSIPPGEAGDPALRFLSPAIAASTLRWIGYLSTVGVYGDHGGAWVDETTPCRPVSARSVARLAAEEGWLALASPERAVQVLRLSGIYGPGQNALENLRAGTARRIIKPGQVFNRIHAADIAGAAAHLMERALDAAADPGLARIVNVTDCEPAPPQDVVAHAAMLMGVTPPPETPFEEAALSPMARSFYGENKRVSNRLLKEDLGYALRYPTYREALAALWDAMRQNGWGVSR
jgi:nucleoside-diphosphate-sugar epimerase